ncbi:hypothetical protein LMG28688_04833 [Paraburkholderia caffeinitolerans]|uniref:Uncharacterized protein n=1 Tax=Paraburkholderia caffeinitolerans TaxID=1723730 RepID=A0A6J5GIR6_9BURK|nr:MULTISPECIES: hypothetical protein [Paraburkholderia]CAB3798851.1 hypothetical protein LMG28688_04833 [Paraburkholderia caffeinitolerans]
MITHPEIETRRKRYAMHRLSLAMKRLIQIDADASHERVMATRWVVAWGAAVGERRFAGLSHGGGGHAAGSRTQSRSVTGWSQ